MGYYSSFEVVETDIPDILEVLTNFEEQYSWGSPGWEQYDGQVRGYDCAKWYGWLTDLQQLAYAYPNNFLIILRYGEESPDMSRAIVKNGTVIEQFPNISWPE
jgi:hypothetical protein